MTYVANMMANLVSNITVQTYSPSSGALQVWFTSAKPSANPAGSGYPAWTYPDGSSAVYPTAAACGSSSSPWLNRTGLGSGGVYIGVAYDIPSASFSLVYGPSATQPTDDQVRQASGDGTLVVVIATASTSGLLGTGGGGGQSVTGGGGHQVTKQ